MFCPNCGTNIPNGSGFCTQCGAGFNPADEPGRPRQQEPVGPDPGKETPANDGTEKQETQTPLCDAVPKHKHKRKLTPMIIGIIAAAAVVVVATAAILIIVLTRAAH